MLAYVYNGIHRPENCIYFGDFIVTIYNDKVEIVHGRMTDPSRQPPIDLGPGDIAPIRDYPVDAGWSMIPPCTDSREAWRA